VVGSGPSGVAAAHALLAQGTTVCMLDVGLTLEPERRQQVAATATTGKVADVRALINDGAFGSTGSTNSYRKLAYGSDFVYRGADAFVDCRSSHHEIHSSFALGGLSNVWGAAAMPFTEDDIRDWPLAPGALEPHFRAVQSFMRLAGSTDTLAEHFPFFAEPLHPLDLSGEATALLAALDSRKEELAHEGIYSGRSRIAVGSSFPPEDSSSILPELFIDGVGNGAVFSAAEVVDELKHYPGFEYIPGATVTGFEETAVGVRVIVRRGKDDKEQILEGSRLFLAAGVMATARIVLSSLHAYERDLPLRQSLHFTLPVLHLFPTLTPSRKDACSLAEIFIALQNTDETGYWSFLSLYHLSGFFMNIIRERYGPLAAGIGALAKSPLLDLFICQGYLHSTLSPEMTLNMSRGAGGLGGKIRVTARPHGEGEMKARRLIRRLSKKVWRSGIFPIGAALNADTPGRGNHVGGTFPMSDQPGHLECDTLGRPKGLSKVHIVDASVLPSIPATTITFGVMANAHRIAKESCTL
jgi:choline dehydrogenase-like flavoprotein